MANSKSKKTKIHLPVNPMAAVPGPEKLTNPLGNAKQNQAAKGVILSQLTQGRGQPKSNENWLRIKGGAVKDVEDYMLQELYAEVYRGVPQVMPTNEAEEGSVALNNGARLKEMSLLQQQDAVVKLQKKIRMEKERCGVAAQEKKMFFQEAEQLKRRIKNNKSALFALDQELVQTKAECQYRQSVNKTKLKNLMMENYDKSYVAKTQQLSAFLPTFGEVWKMEKTAYENLQHQIQSGLSDRMALNNLLRAVTLDQVVQTHTVKEEFVALQESLVENHEDFVEDTRKRTEDQMKEYIRVLDLDKNRRINHMLEIQAKCLNSLKNYFQDIASSNSDMINDLKKEADGRRVRLEQLERSIYTSLEELNQYQGPIQETEAQILHSENVLQTSKAVKLRLTKKHMNRRMLVDDVKRYTWMREVEETRVLKCKDELAELEKAQFSSRFSILEKTALSEIINGRTWILLVNEVNMYEMCCSLLRGLKGCSTIAVDEVKNSIQAVLQTQNAGLIELQGTIALIQKMHREMWENIGACFQGKTNSSLESLGFLPPDLGKLFPKKTKKFQKRGSFSDKSFTDVKSAYPFFSSVPSFPYHTPSPSIALRLNSMRLSISERPDLYNTSKSAQEPI